MQRNMPMNAQVLCMSLSRLIHLIPFHSFSFTRETDREKGPDSEKERERKRQIEGQREIEKMQRNSPKFSFSQCIF